MQQLKLVAALMLGGVLAACGSSSSDDGDPDPGPGPGPGPGDEVESEIDIQTESLPLTESFDTDGFEGEEAVSYFFSPDKKQLNTPATNTVIINDEEVELVDEHPSFYYPTCCYWDEDDSGARTGDLIEDLKHRWDIQDGMLAISNARFTIGQILSDLVDQEKTERKSDTSDGVEGASITEGSWGELDLSEPYMVSFCVNETGQAGGGNSDFEVWVDNNSGGRSEESIHSSDSLLLRTETPGIGNGKRLTVEVPGDVYLTNADGDKQTLNVIEPLDDDYPPIGTMTSFLQLRVSSGGYAIISDLVIEYQDDEPVEKEACEPLEESFYEPPPEPEATGIPFDRLPLEMDFSVGRETFFRDEDSNDGFLAMSDDAQEPFYEVLSSGSRIHINGQDRLRFGNAYWAAGDRTDRATTEDDLSVDGDINLSVPYSITMEITDVPEFAGDGLQIRVDNNTTSSGSSIHGEASRLTNLTDELEEGTLVVNVPGDITMNGAVIGNVAEHLGTETSFLTFRCPGDCGDAEDGDTGGIEFSEVVIDYTGEEPEQPIWTASSLILAGDTDDADGKVDEESEDSITITATGGNVDSSSHNLFFARQQTDSGDFAVTARIVSVEGADDPAGNGKRFGLMVIKDLQPVGNDYADLAGWADAGFYAEEVEGTVELIGSRGNKKPDGSRTRSDIDDLQEGYYVRIEVMDDGAEKRVRRCSSPDGVNWTNDNSTTDFDATADDDSWYYGVYAAPGSNEITMELDNISIEEGNVTQCEDL